MLKLISWVLDFFDPAGWAFKVLIAGIVGYGLGRMREQLHLLEILKPET